MFTEAMFANSTMSHTRKYHLMRLNQLQISVLNCKLLQCKAAENNQNFFSAPNKMDFTVQVVAEDATFYLIADSKMHMESWINELPSEVST